jgi:hypothetical protein
MQAEADCACWSGSGRPGPCIARHDCEEGARQLITSRPRSPEGARRSGSASVRADAPGETGDTVVSHRGKSGRLDRHGQPPACDQPERLGHHESVVVDREFRVTQSLAHLRRMPEPLMADPPFRARGVFLAFAQCVSHIHITKTNHPHSCRLDHCDRIAGGVDHDLAQSGARQRLVVQTVRLWREGVSRPTVRSAIGRNGRRQDRTTKARSVNEINNGRALVVGFRKQGRRCSPYHTEPDRLD